MERDGNWRVVWVWWKRLSGKKKKKACGINDKVESLKCSFTVIHLWQKMWAIILGVRSKPKYQVSILCERNTCAGEHLLASAQMQLPKPCSSGWIQNNTSSPSLFVLQLKPRQRIFNSREKSLGGFRLNIFLLTIIFQNKFFVVSIKITTNPFILGDLAFGFFLNVNSNIFWQSCNIPDKSF